MSITPAALLRPRRCVVFALLYVAAALLLMPAFSNASPKPSVLTFKTVTVGAPGNPGVGVVPFTDAIYQSCSDAPQTKPACQQVGGVKYRYGVGQLEVTVPQWVAFLNTVDAKGRDKHHLYSATESSSAWPKYGQINFSSSASTGRHYTVASQEWADKPYGFANFLRSARFINSLYNGRLLSKKSSAEGGFRYVTYRVRLSTKTEHGMYDMRKRGATRGAKRGFVIPSQDEWIKSAYYDPAGGGTYSYWKYPTNAGVFGDGSATAPTVATLDPGTGEVTNGATQPLATFREKGQPTPTWCPATFQPADECNTLNPFGLDATTYGDAFQGGLSGVGQAGTTSPWGTLDQGGNAVEWTDTITPPPTGRSGGHGRVWRRLHGGISNAPAYQMWISAVGLQPQDNTLFTATYPWLGFRIGVIGNLTKTGKG